MALIGEVAGNLEAVMGEVVEHLFEATGEETGGFVWDGTLGFPTRESVGEPGGFFPGTVGLLLTEGARVTVLGKIGLAVVGGATGFSPTGIFFS